MVFRKFFKRVLVPAGLLASLIIGAGIFSLPYVFVRAGTIYSLFCLAFFAWVMSETHSRYAEVMDENDGDKRFVGYAGDYFGRKGYIAALVFAVGGMAFALSVFLSLAPSFVNLIFPSTIAIVGSLSFWAVGSILAFSGVKKFASTGLILFTMMAAIIIILLFASFFWGNAGNIFSATLFNPVNLIFPFGPLLFSLAGRFGLSSIRSNYGGEDYNIRDFKKSIKIGTFVPAALYAIFAAAIISLSPAGVSPDAVSGIAGIPGWLFATTGVLGLFSLITTYAFLGMEFMGVLIKDVKISPFFASLFLAAAPITIYFLSSGDFIRLVGIAGGIFLAAESIMVVRMGRKAAGRRISDIPLMAVFILGIIYEVTGFFR